MIDYPKLSVLVAVALCGWGETLGAKNHQHDIVVRSLDGTTIAEVRIPTDNPWQLGFMPDERSLYVASAGGREIWLLDLDGSAPRRLDLPQPPCPCLLPVWAPDGRTAAFYSPTGPGALQIATLSPLFAATVLAEPATSIVSVVPTSWTPDGRHVLYDSNRILSHMVGNFDIWVATKDNETPPRPWLATEANESGGRVSPDGAWVAYVSDASGEDRIYVRGFAAANFNEVLSVAPEGGDRPRWSDDGKVIYVAPRARLVARALATNPPSLGEPRLVLDCRAVGRSCADIVLDRQMERYAFIRREQKAIPTDHLTNP